MDGLLDAITGAPLGKIIGVLMLLLASALMLACVYAAVLFAGHPGDGGEW